MCKAQECRLYRLLAGKDKISWYARLLQSLVWTARGSILMCMKTWYITSVRWNPAYHPHEAGDLQYEAFLELKALWNATERCCAWYMMGADGLKEKINRSIECKKVGYTEMLSRYGDRYSKVTPDDGKEREQFLNNQARIVAKVNAPAGADIAQIVRKTCGGLRRVYTEIEKLKMTAE